MHGMAWVRCRRVVVKCGDGVDVGRRLAVHEDFRFIVATKITNHRVAIHRHLVHHHVLAIPDLCAASFESQDHRLVGAIPVGDGLDGGSTPSIGAGLLPERLAAGIKDEQRIQARSDGPVQSIDFQPLQIWTVIGEEYLLRFGHVGIGP
jgi:hypothetical protein